MTLVADSPENTPFFWPLSYVDLSASSISLLTKCPESWRRRYLKGEKPPVPGNMARGRMLHAGVATMWRARQAGEEPSSDAIIEALVESRDGEPVAWDSPGEAEETLHSAAAGIAAYQAFTLGDEPPLGVEERFEAAVEGSFVRIQGIVDARFADHVREVKTSKVKNTTPRPEWRIQSVLYQALTGLPVRHDQVIPHKGEVVPLAAEPVFDAERVAGLLATRAATTIMTLSEAYGDDESWPLSGYAHPYACSGCSHRSTCQAWT